MNIERNSDLAGIESLKGRFPFRIGTTSYIIPDDILPNVRFLADRVDDIELVLFESGGQSNIPGKDVVAELKAVAASHGLTYTVHLPIDIHTGHTDAVVRQYAVDQCRRIMDRMAAVMPAAYILHLEGDQRGGMPSMDMPSWKMYHAESVMTLVESVPSEKLCIETLDYPLELVEDIISSQKLSVCLDVGHLLLYGHNVADYLNHYFPETRVIHLHGIDNGIDHRSIHHLPSPFIRDLFNQLTQNPVYTGIVTLEIFSRSDFDRSIQTIRQSMSADDRDPVKG